MEENKIVFDALKAEEIFNVQDAKISALQTDLAAEKEAHLATKQTNNSLQETIEEMESLTEAVTKPAPVKIAKVPTNSFKVDKAEYVFTIPAFIHAGVKITAEQALENEELLHKLVEMSFGGIKRKGAK